MRRLTLGHSPDPDDAFMFYGLASGKIDSRRWAFEHVLQDIQTLNERALRAELDITAISIHNYPFVAADYALTACGASMGDGYGPMLLTKNPVALHALRGARIAIPGERTTAYLALCLLLGRSNFVPVLTVFDQIPAAVANDQVDAGLVIHEGQLTFERLGLHLVVDLGAWWKSQTGLPLPLGGNCIRRALGFADMQEITAILKESIQFGLDHRDEAVAYAMRFGRDLDRPLTDRFVGMYVNDWTVDYGKVGREAIHELLRRGAEAGLVPPVGHLDFVG